MKCSQQVARIDINLSNEKTTSLIQSNYIEIIFIGLLNFPTEKSAVRRFLS